jgi:hypothetical protein
VLGIRRSNWAKSWLAGVALAIHRMQKGRRWRRSGMA